MTEITVTEIDTSAFWRLSFSNGPGNILDQATMTQLTAVFRRAAATGPLKAICLEGVGSHFSFGASVQEHLPGQVESMLAAFREMALAMLESDVVVVAAVRGQCLGGGLELATLCHRIIASADARFGQPEIALGVFAPVGSIALVERIGRPAAEELCLTGRSVDAEFAQRIGLVSSIHEHPIDAALAWARENFGPRSASSLRHAVRAIRASLLSRLRTELPALESQYLNQLMQTADAAEGLAAFIEKRSPVWKDH